MLDLQNIAIQQKLQTGGSGEVYSGSLLQNGCETPVAIKVIQLKSSELKNHFIKESQIARKLGGHFCPKVFTHFIKKNQGVIVMERMFTDFYDATEISLSQSVIKTIFYKIAQAIRHCHRNKIAHLDIKPENILLDQSLRSVKLCDFGHAIDFSSDLPQFNTFPGTEFYMAPEFLTKQTIIPDKADIWSFGVMLYVTITGEYPYPGTGNEQKVNFKAGKLNLSALSQCEFDTSCKMLITKLLNVNPLQRPSVDEVLNSPWFR